MSLLTTEGRAYGYLFSFSGHGVFSPDGKTEFTAEQAEAHNRALSEAELLSLDQNCQVGQGGTFYYTNGSVRTWTGTIVSETILRSGRNGRSITFKRNGKTYRGILRKDADCFNFRRVS